MPTLTTLIQHNSGNSGQCNQARKGNKSYEDRKEEIKFSLFAGDIIIHRENPKASTKMYLELVNEFNKVTG